MPVQRIIHETSFLLQDTMYVFLGQDESFQSSVSSCAIDFQTRTTSYWKKWCNGLVLPATMQHQVLRSAITLQLLQSGECGGLIQSVTMGVGRHPSAIVHHSQRITSFVLLGNHVISARW